MGDPFIGILNNTPLEYQIFNRAVIERTILDCNTLSKVKFDGRYITVCSQGIENCLSELEIIWLIAHDLRKAELEDPAIEHRVPKMVKLTSMGKLAAILKYFLQTSYSLIADVKLKDLKSQLAALPECERRKFLLRYRTNLKIQKHETKPIIGELLRVVELELEFLNNLDSSNPDQNKVSPSTGISANAIIRPVDLETDFNYELSVKHFPWCDVIRKEELFKQELKREFEILPLKPKLHWYFNEFISDDEWQNDRLSAKPMANLQTNEIIAAPFKMPSDTEVKAIEVIRKFDDMKANNSVDPKYYGRMLDETNLVQTLKKLNEQIIQFKRYVFTSADINTFADYGKAAANSIVAQLSKLNNKKLTILLLQEAISMDIVTDITVFSNFSNKTEKQKSELLSRFDILIVYARQIFNEALTSFSDSNQSPKIKLIKPEFRTIFKNQEQADRYIEILRQVFPAVISINNDYLLGERKKSSIVLWYDLLVKRGVVYSNIPPKRKAELLNELFPGLTISERSINSANLAIQQIYEDQLERLISTI